MAVLTLRPILSITENQCFMVLKSFLSGIVIPDTTPILRAQQNLTPEPKLTDFIIMTPLLQERLSTNYTTYVDTVITGSINNLILTVTAIEKGFLFPGLLLIDSLSNISPNTIIVSQIDGTPGGIGDYNINISQTIVLETIYAGLRDDLEPTRLTIQLDVHGPNSGNNIKIIETLFRSEYSTQNFSDSGIEIQPLHCSDPRQMPFINAEQQYEYRWTIDAVMQFNSIVGTPQQFFTEIKIDLIEANAL